MKIGVFDSGVGGQAVATSIGLAFPDDDVVFINDHENVPYGAKTEIELLDLSRPKLHNLAIQGCRVIVVACNSVSTTILDQLQSEIEVPLIGVEPMIKEAVNMSNSKVITVCATPRTLKSKRYAQLCQDYAGETVIIEPDCSQWADMIENQSIDRLKIELTISDTLDQGADVIVLGCTHYHWIQALISSVCTDRATVVQPEQHIIQKLKTVLGQQT